MTINKVIKLLKELKWLDGERFFKKNAFQIFGSKYHKYKLNTCLTEQELLRFENRYSIKLPSDYRDFLKQVGNGGAGPWYGLFPLNRWDVELDVENEVFLLTPFPHVEKWNMQYDGDVESEYYTDGEEYQNWELEYFSNKHITGSLRLCHYGCAIYYLLIVTGQDKGNIWVDNRTNDGGIYPLVSTLTGKRITFIEWYYDWLETSIYSLKSKK